MKQEPKKQEKAEPRKQLTDAEIEACFMAFLRGFIGLD